MLQDLPLALLGSVFRAAASAGAFDRLAPVLNLVCHATRDALPDAFTADDDGAAAGDSGDVPGAPSAELSRTFQAEATWEPYTATPAGTTPPVLQLDLDRLGTAAFENLVSPASVRHTGQRFSRAASVRLLVTTTLGVYGSTLFAEHAAPVMVGVRSLFITGQPATTLAPFWQLSAFLSGLGAAVRELHVSAHHSSLAHLAAALPTTFPALTAVRLVMWSDNKEGCWGLHASGIGLWGVTFCASPLLTALLLSVEIPDSNGYSGDDGDLRDYPFTLTLVGDPCCLTHLHIDTRATSADSPEFICHHSRPWVLVGHLPAVETLDVTLAPDDPVAHWPGGPVARPPFAPPLHQTCPALRSLVVRSDGSPSLSAWTAVFEALAPLAGGLTWVELHLPYRPRCPGGPPTGSQGALWPLVDRLLPQAQLTVEEVPLW